MQPWKISACLTAALAGSDVLLAGARFKYLAPFWPVILADYGTSTVLHLTLALAAVAAAIYAIARAAGLADLGRRVDLDERSVGQQAQRQEQLPAQRELFDYISKCSMPFDARPN